VLFFALTAWQIQIFSDRAGRRGRGWLFAALFASMPVVPLVASWGYAEAPFWLMLVCAMSRLLLWRDSGARQDLWLAGICIAGAACTKNEGILFAVLSVAWVALCGRKFRDMAAVILPVLLFAGAWKAYCVFGMDASKHAVASLASTQPGLSQWAGMLAEAGKYVWIQWTDVKQWNLVLPAALLASSPGTLPCLMLLICCCSAVALAAATSLFRMMSVTFLPGIALYLSARTTACAAVNPIWVSWVMSAWRPSPYRVVSAF